VEPDRLRFDFTHPTRLTADELRRVQEALNAAVWADLPVRAQHESREDAMGRGALALFSDKYGTTVRTVEVPLGSAAAAFASPESQLTLVDLGFETRASRQVPGVSLELCGGTHVDRTGVLHPIIVTSETAVAAGRRLQREPSAAAAAPRRRLTALRNVPRGRINRRSPD